MRMQAELVINAETVKEIHTARDKCNREIEENGKYLSGNKGSVQDIYS